MHFSENLYIVLIWQSCGSGGGFCEKTSAATLKKSEPVLADSKMDLPLTKAEPISNFGSTSVVDNIFEKG